MRLDTFRKVVGTKTYQAKPLAGSPLDNNGDVNTYFWESTNKLLGSYEGLIGCKTGITNQAGPCFAGYYEMDDIKLAIILCNSNHSD